MHLLLGGLSNGTFEFCVLASGQFSLESGHRSFISGYLTRYLPTYLGTYLPR